MPHSRQSPTIRHQVRHRTLSREETYRDGHLSKAAFLSLAILTLITFVGNFTQLQLSAALPTIVREFGISVTTGQWMTSVFQLVMGIMVPLTAFLTRRFSTRHIVITSMAVFTVGSALAWLSPTFPLVLLGRTLQACGTGVMWPVLQITVFSIYPLSRRGVSMGTVGMAMSVAPALGPTVGGWQTDAHGWRSIFLTLTLIGACCIALSAWGLRDFGTQERGAKADLFSACLSVIGFGGLMFGFTNIEAHPLTHPMVWLPTVAGLGGIVWFVLRQIRTSRRFERAMRTAHTLKADSIMATTSTPPSPLPPSESATAETSRMAVRRNPLTRWTHARATHRRDPQPALLDLGVLRNRSFTIGTTCASLSFFAFSSILVIIPLYIQDDRHFSSTMSGLIMLPGAFGQCLAQFLGGKLLDRLGARPVALAGSITLCLGTAMMSMLDISTWIWWISLCQFIRQIGLGLVLMPITTWSLNCLEPGEVSAGSAVTNTARQISGAVGAPVLVVSMEMFAAWRHSTWGGSPETAVASNVFGVQWALRISAFLCFLLVTIVFFGVKGNGAGSTHDTVQRALRRLHGTRAHHGPAA